MSDVLGRRRMSTGPVTGRGCRRVTESQSVGSSRRAKVSAMGAPVPGAPREGPGSQGGATPRARCPAVGAGQHGVVDPLLRKVRALQHGSNAVQDGTTLGGDAADVPHL